MRCKSVSNLLVTLGMLIGLLTATAVSGCTGNQRQDTLRASLVAVDAVRDGFVEYDKRHQAKIVDAATSVEQGKAALVSYRERRAKFLAAFPVVYRSIAFALSTSDDKSLTAAVEQAKALLDAYENFKESL